MAERTDTMNTQMPAQGGRLCNCNVTILAEPASNPPPRPPQSTRTRNRSRVLPLAAVRGTRAPRSFGPTCQGEIGTFVWARVKPVDEAVHPFSFLPVVLIRPSAISSCCSYRVHFAGSTLSDSYTEHTLGVYAFYFRLRKISELEYSK